MANDRDKIELKRKHRKSWLYLYLTLLADKSPRILLKILSNFSKDELRSVIALLKKGKENTFRFQQKELYSSFAAQLKEMRTRSFRETQISAKRKQDDTLERNYIYYSIILIAGILIWLIFDRFIPPGYLDAEQKTWFSFMGFLMVLPFFWSYAVKYKYFSKKFSLFKNINLILFGSAFTIALVGIINYQNNTLNHNLSANMIKMFFIFVFAGVLGPWIEELLFRGLILDLILSFYMKKEFSFLQHAFQEKSELIAGNFFLLSAVISSLLFALVHDYFSLLSFLLYFLSGLIFAGQRYFCGSLWCSWISHVAANSFYIFY